MTDHLFSDLVDSYARFRKPIPDEVVRAVFDLAAPDAMRGALLDLGSGTGLALRAFAPYFTRAFASDIDAEMLRRAEADWPTTGITTPVTWRVSDAATVDLPTDVDVSLITICRAFHWMDQPAVLAHCAEMVTAPASIAIFSEDSVWEHDEPWAVAVRETIQRYLGTARKARNQLFPEARVPYVDMLRASAFSDADETSVATTRSWTPEELLGYLYSTTFAAPDQFGEQRAAFEADVEAAIAPYLINGRVEELVDYRVTVGTFH